MDMMEGEDLSEHSDEEDWMDTAWSNEDMSSMSSELSKTTKLPNTSASMQHIQGLLPHAKINEDITKSEKKMDDSLMSRMRLNDHKAGMEGLDKEKINQIILEASKGSKFYENERKKEEQVRKRIQEQQEKYEKITEAQLSQGLVQADMLLEEFERARDLSHTIVHIDMDAFYAAVEIRDKPSLKDKPMAVGSNSMLSTSNYHARKYGVRAAMPGFIGKKLCPDLTIVPLNFEKYTSVSKQVKIILAEYDPNFCPMSLDEAYLDITDHLQKRRMMTEEDRTFYCRKCDNLDTHHCLCDLNEVMKKSTCENKSSNLLQEGKKMKLDECESNPEADVKSLKCLEDTNVCPVCGKPFPDYDAVVFGTSPDDTVQEMRSRIEQRTRLTASAGIAPNMMLSKVCSDKNKPNGQYRIQPTVECVMDFIKDLPIRKISGIGKVSEQMLNAVGVVTCTDLYNKRALLYHLYSQISFNYFMRICLGIGSTTVERDSERKSISTERTFSEISKPVELYSKCKELCEALSVDLEEEQLKGKTVTVKLKTVKFEVKTRAHTLPEYTSDVEVIFSAAKDLLKTEIQNVTPSPLRLRLMGVRMSSLLHQSLCKSKQKQRTLSGIVKKMVNKSTSNNTAQDTQTTEKITSDKSTNNGSVAGVDDVEQNDSITLSNSKVTRLCSNQSELESCLEKMSCISTPATSIVANDLNETDRSCDIDREDNTSSQNPLLMKAKGHGISNERPNMGVCRNIDTFMGGIFDANGGSASQFNPGTHSDLETVPCFSIGPISTKNKDVRDDGIELDCVDNLELCENKIVEGKENKNQCRMINERTHKKCENNSQEFDNENPDVITKSSNACIKLSAQETGNDLETLTENGSNKLGETTTRLSIEREQGTSEERSCTSERLCNLDDKNTCIVSLEREKGCLGEDPVINERSDGPEDTRLIEHGTDALDTEMENVYECPVCRNDVKCETLSDFNQHIDICLNKKVVMDCSRDGNLQADLKQNTKLLVHKKSPSLYKKSKIRSNHTKSPKSVVSKYSDMKSPKSTVSKYADKKSTPSKFVKSLEPLPSKSANNNLVSFPAMEDMSQNKQNDGQNESEIANLDFNFNKNDVPAQVDLNYNSTNDSKLTAKETIPHTSTSDHSNTTGQEMTITKLICPVCFMEQTGASLDEFNSHMDTCLSKGAITDILKEQKTDEDKVLNKRSNTDALQEKLKVGKRKRASSGQTPRNNKQNKLRSIDLFFKA